MSSLEQVRTNHNQEIAGIIRNQFYGATPAEIIRAFDTLYSNVFEENPMLGVYKTTTRVVAQVPPKLPNEVYENILAIVRSNPTKESHSEAMRALMGLSLRSVLSATNFYSYAFEGDEDDIFATGLTAVNKVLGRKREYFTSAVNVEAKNEILNYLAEREGVTPAIMRSQKYRGVIEVVRELNNGKVIFKATPDEILRHVASQTGIEEEELREYLYHLSRQKDERFPNTDYMEEQASIKRSRKIREIAKSVLGDQDFEILMERFVFERTLAVIGRNRGVSGARISQRESRSLRILRHPENLKRFEEFQF